MDSSIDFSSLVLITEDYVKDTSSPYPDYHILRDGLHTQISFAFNEKVTEKFSKEDWIISSGWAPWDNEKAKPLVVVTPKPEPKASFIATHAYVFHGVLPSGW